MKITMLKEEGKDFLHLLLDNADVKSLLNNRRTVMHKDLTYVADNKDLADGILKTALQGIRTDLCDYNNLTYMHWKDVISYVKPTDEGNITVDASLFDFKVDGHKIRRRMKELLKRLKTKGKEVRIPFSFPFELESGVETFTVDLLVEVDTYTGKNKNGDIVKELDYFDDITSEGNEDSIMLFEHWLTQSAEGESNEGILYKHIKDVLTPHNK